MVRKAINLVLLSAALLAVSGCNTVRGVGADVKSAANSVDRAT